MFCMLFLTIHRNLFLYRCLESLLQYIGCIIMKDDLFIDCNTEPSPDNSNYRKIDS